MLPTTKELYAPLTVTLHSAHCTQSETDFGRREYLNLNFAHTQFFVRFFVSHYLKIHFTRKSLTFVVKTNPFTFPIWNVQLKWKICAMRLRWFFFLAAAAAAAAALFRSKQRTSCQKNIKSWLFFTYRLVFFSL